MSLAVPVLPVLADEAEADIPAIEQAIVKNPGGEIKGHKLVASSDTHELYLYEPTLSIIVRDKATGAIMESTLSENDPKSNKKWNGYMRSGVVLGVITGINDTGQADLINDDVTINIKYLSNGFCATLFYNKYQFGFDMQVTLDGDKVTATIPDDKIVEKLEYAEGETVNYIATITMYPFLGHTYLGERDGYMLVPDGNGALIYLDDKEGRYSAGFTQLIYGENKGSKVSSVVSLYGGEMVTVNPAENVLAPVFGMVHTDSQMGYLGNVESGAYSCYIECYPNGALLNYNRCYAKFQLRKLVVTPTSSNSGGSITSAETDRTHEDLTVSYTFVTGDNANYIGLANEYREHLLDTAAVAQQDASYKTRVDFLGSDREEWLIFKKAVPMTTVEDIENIYEELKAEGVTDILTQYKGWQKGGIQNLPVTKYKLDSSLGKTRELTKLMESLEDTGIDFYLYQNGLKINPDENNTTFNVIKRTDKRLYEDVVYGEVYYSFLYLTPMRSDYLVRDLMKNFKKAGVKNIAFSGISNEIFQFYYDRTFYSREYTADIYEKLFADISAENNLLLEQPYAYAWKYIDAYIDMPMFSSDYAYLDEEVPFLTTVLKGIIPMYSEYMNFEANKEEFFLKMVETGVYPSFYITMEDSSALIYTNSSDIYTSKYSVFKNDIIEYDKALKEVYNATAGATISGHDNMDNGVTVVTYSNGVKIYINYTENAATVDGHSIDGMSYTLVP